MPFNKDELNAILKFGAEELFKEKEEDDGEEPEVDIDLILQRAETRELETGGGAADELLSQFKVANFTIDEDSNIDMPNRQEAARAAADNADEKSWDDIIPESERRKAEEDEKREQELAPRARNRLQKMARNEESDEEEWGANGKKRKRGAESESEAESSDEDRPKTTKKQKKLALHGFTEAEIRKFVRSYKKFAQPLTRLEAIACDAELEEHSKKELQLLADALETGCKKAVEDYTKSSLSHHEKENTEEDEGKRKERGPVFKLGGVEVTVKPLLKSQADLEALALSMPSEVQERRRFQLPAHVRPQKTWDVEWLEENDAALLRGIYDYGFGSWERIKMDPELGLIEKICAVDRTKKPQGKHLQTRADYLLRFLQKRVELSLAAGNLPKPKRSPTKSLVNMAAAEANATDKKSRRKKATTADAQIAAEGSIQQGTPGERKLRQKDKAGEDQKKAPSKPPPPAINLDKFKVDPNLESAMEGDVFKECKDSMRVLKEHLRNLNEEVKSPKFVEALLKIGDRIAHCLAPKYKDKDKKKLSDWHSYFWLFASKFSELDGTQLHKLFRKLNKKRAEAQQQALANAKEKSTVGSGAPSDVPEGDHKHPHHRHHKHVAGSDQAKKSQPAVSGEEPANCASTAPVHAAPQDGRPDPLKSKRGDLLDASDNSANRTSSPLAERHLHIRADRSASRYGAPLKHVGGVYRQSENASGSNYEGSREDNRDNRGSLRPPWRSDDRDRRRPLLDQEPRRFDRPSDEPRRSDGRRYESAPAATAEPRYSGSSVREHSQDPNPRDPRSRDRESRDRDRAPTSGGYNSSPAGYNRIPTSERERRSGSGWMPPTTDRSGSGGRSYDPRSRDSDRDRYERSRTGSAYGSQGYYDQRSSTGSTTSGMTSSSSSQPMYASMVAGPGYAYPYNSTGSYDEQSAQYYANSGNVDYANAAVYPPPPGPPATSSKALPAQTEYPRKPAAFANASNSWLPTPDGGYAPASQPGGALTVEEFTGH